MTKRRKYDLTERLCENIFVWWVFTDQLFVFIPVK